MTEANLSSCTIPILNKKQEVVGVAHVDLADFEYLSQFTWRLLKTKGTNYAVRRDKGKTILMHREIVDAPDELTVDHRDRDGLNNIRKNLRLVTHAQNHQNKGVRADSSSKIRGVRLRSWGKWQARAKLGGKEIHLGTFDTSDDAELAIIEWRKGNMEFSND
jgi:hypothetical protein